MINVFYRVASVEIWAHCKRDDAYYSPTEGVTITITDPAGTAQVEDAAMTEDEEGKFVYTYNIPSDGGTGWWQCEMIGQDGTDPDDKYAIGNVSFEVK